MLKSAHSIYPNTHTQGALFRTYPGGFQCLLDTGNGRYRRVETLKGRPPLSGFKSVRPPSACGVLLAPVCLPGSLAP